MALIIDPALQQFKDLKTCKIPWQGELEKWTRLLGEAMIKQRRNEKPKPQKLGIFRGTFLNVDRAKSESLTLKESKPANVPLAAKKKWNSKGGPSMPWGAVGSLSSYCDRALATGN